MAATCCRERRGRHRGPGLLIRYALLLLPAVNRVYARAAPALGRAELSVINAFGLDGRLHGLGGERLGGVPYLTFATKEGACLEPGDAAVLSNLSCIYALFERDASALRPVGLTPLDRWDADLLTIARYAGKTNEQFTKLLVNLALVVGHTAGALSALAVSPGGARLRVLDPLCGRGTTLNQAVMYGLDAAGVELDGRDVDAYVNFLATWLKDKQAKHHVERQRLRRDGRVLGHRVTITVAETKDAQRRGEVQTVVVIGDDTARVLDHLGRSSVDALVADLPYGVQHGSRTGSHLGRRPLDLLAEALPPWRSVLRPGSALALAWNTKTLSRPAMRQVLEDAGLEVVDLESHGSFAHQVDRAVTRDVIVARRPGK